MTEARIRQQPQFWWRRPYVRIARGVINVLYRAMCKNQRANVVLFISRQTDVPTYDFSALAHQFQQRGWSTIMHLKKVTRRTMVSYIRHVFGEIRLLAQCKVAVVDRYDPVICLIDFECDEQSTLQSRIQNEAQCKLKIKTEPLNLDFPRKPIILQMWHAFGAFKKFGFQYVDTPEGHSADFMADWRIHRNYSWIACSGSGVRSAYADAFSCPEERVVILKRPEYDELISLRNTIASKHAKERVRVLMAPTLRKSSLAIHPFRDLYKQRREFEKSIDAQIVWTFHPLECGLPAPGNVSEELLESDIVVTDYSSLVFEAFLLGKPVLFYIPDIEAYRLSPGLNRDPLEKAPDLCALTEQALIDLLAVFVANPTSYAFDSLKRFIGSTFDGATTNPVDFILEKVETNKDVLS